MTPEDAIFEMREELATIKAVLVGIPNTDDKGLVGTVKENCENLDATRKKVGRLEVRFWILVAFLVGSGVLGGYGISQLLAAAP